MDAAGELHVQPLLDGLEEVHHEVMRDVVTAEREHVLVFRPLAFHERDVEPFLLEEALLDRGEDRRLAGEADVADADLVGVLPRSFCSPTRPARRTPSPKVNLFIPGLPPMKPIPKLLPVFRL